MSDPDDVPSLFTPRLRVFRASPSQLSNLIAGAEAYQQQHGDRVAEGCIEFPGALEFSLRQAQTTEEEGHWWLPYFFVHQVDATLIGVGGFKGPPDADGTLEFGYGIAPAYQCQGLATEAAEALTEHALSLPGITRLRAHTLPEVNASCSVLIKCGLTHVGEFYDPDDGTVWRWERTTSVSDS